MLLAMRNLKYVEVSNFNRKFLYEFASNVLGTYRKQINAQFQVQHTVQKNMAYKNACIPITRYFPLLG